MSGKSGRLIVIGLALIGAAVIGNAVLYAFGVSPFNLKEIRDVQSVSAEGVSRSEIRTDDGDVSVVAGGGDTITAIMEGSIGSLSRDGPAVPRMRGISRWRWGDNMAGGVRGKSRRSHSVGAFFMKIRHPDLRNVCWQATLLDS